jgi:AcrR family transcriptional regulator
MNESRKSSSGGRPTHDESARLSDRILDVARGLFIAQGFEATSIEQIASAAHVAKRTVYSRFDGKEGVFDGVIKRHIDRNLLEMDELDLDGHMLEERLRRLSVLLLEHVLDPQSVELDRAITAEALKFPNLARLYREHGAPRYSTSVVEILLSCPQEYKGTKAQAAHDASTFLILIVLPLLRLAHFSPVQQVRQELDTGVIEKRLRFFMRGICAEP